MDESITLGQRHGRRAGSRRALDAARRASLEQLAPGLLDRVQEETGLGRRRAAGEVERRLGVHWVAGSAPAASERGPHHAPGVAR